MTRADRILAALLTTSLATVVLAQSEHHVQGDATRGVHDPHGSMGGMHGPAMHGRGGMMSHMHERMHEHMHEHMHEMMAQMHDAPPDGMGAPMRHASPPMLGLDGLTGEEYEVAFLSMMIGHHVGAIDMADWILERSEDPDVLAAAEAITAAQDPEIQQMTAWLREWYDTGVAADWADPMSADMSTMMGAMEQGDDPDVAFLEQMIRHHQGAIDMAQVALERATHAEVRDLARDIILAQVDEVHQYRTWLAEERAE